MKPKKEKKCKILLRYAEDFPINDFPGFTSIMSPDSKYVKVSDNVLHLVGYKNQRQIYKTTYHNMPCQASEYANKFEQQDHLAIRHEIKILSYNHFAGGWKVFLGHKKPIMIDNKAVGVLANFIDVTHGNVIDLSRFLFHGEQQINKKQFSYVIHDINDFHGLTRREQECLFFAIRGFSYCEISKKLGIAIPTVQTYIEHIKEKFDVVTRSQLSEKATHLGFMGVIPKSLFK